MYTAHIKTSLVNSFLSLALADGSTNGGESEFVTTSLALCLADSLIQCYLASPETYSLDAKDAIFDVRHQATQYVKWWRGGHLSVSGEPGAPDKATEGVLRVWEDGLRDGVSTAEILEQAEAEQSKMLGCSISVLWVLPIALVFWRDQEMAVELARSATGVLSPASRTLAGWYVKVVAAVLWESADKKNLKFRKLGLGREFEAEFTRLGLQNTEAAEDVRKGLSIFLETTSFADGLEIAICFHPQTSMAYAGIAGAWYGSGVETVKRDRIVGTGLVERVAGFLGILAKILEKRDDNEMQIIASNVPLDDEFEGTL